MTEGDEVIGILMRMQILHASYIFFFRRIVLIEMRL